MIFKTKSELREAMLAKRKAMASSQIQTASARVCDRALEVLLTAAKVLPPRPLSIALYSPVHAEIDPSALFDRLRTMDYEVLYPKVKGDSLEFHAISDAARLKPGSWNILEPQDEAPCDPDVILVPGLAFSVDGDRLGYGKGYYDATIRSFIARGRSSPLLVGLAYNFQILESLPTEEHDSPVDVVVSENYSLRRAKVS